MKEGNNRGGLSWAPIDVGPQAEAFPKFRGINLKQLHKWSISQYLTVSRFYHRMDLFDGEPCMAQGNMDKLRKAKMNQWTKREAEPERDIAHREFSQQILLIGFNSCGPLASRRTRLKTLILRQP